MTTRREFVKIQVPPRTKKSLFEINPVLLTKVDEMVSFVRNDLTPSNCSEVFDEDTNDVKFNVF